VKLRLHLCRPRSGSTDVVSKPASSCNLPIGYLRAFVTVLVLAHHAVLAFHAFAPPVPASQPRWWQAFPVVDSQRWSGFALFVGFNDVFFMSLMFSGDRSAIGRRVRHGSFGFCSPSIALLRRCWC
jgi:hypothetical protein